MRSITSRKFRGAILRRSPNRFPRKSLSSARRLRAHVPARPTRKTLCFIFYFSPPNFFFETEKGVFWWFDCHKIAEASRLRSGGIAAALRTRSPEAKCKNGKLTKVMKRKYEVIITTDLVDALKEHEMSAALILADHF